MEIFEGMEIKIFPETEKEAYIRLIHENGFHCHIKRDRIIVGNRLRDPVDKAEGAKRIKDARKLNGLTRQQAASRLGISRDTLVDWEMGRRYPNKKNRLRLAELYHVDF